MCRPISKIFLIVFNVLCSLVALVLIFLGVALKYQLNNLLKEIEETDLDLSFVPAFILILGIVVFLIAFCGCCGAIANSKCLLVTYVLIVAVLAAVKIYITFTLLNNFSTHRSTIEGYVNDIFTNPETKETSHLIEAVMHCCGTHGPNSYKDTNLLPPTCCEEPSINPICPIDRAFKEGCINMAGETFESIAKSGGTALICIIIAEVLAITACIIIIVKAETPLRVVACRDAPEADRDAPEADRDAPEPYRFHTYSIVRDIAVCRTEHSTLR